MLDDLGVLTGGRVFLRGVGDTVEAVKPEHLGGARRIWADQEYFGVVNGKGSPVALRDHVNRLRNAYECTEDLDMRRKMRERIGKLMGGAAILMVGGNTDLEIKARKDSAERTSNALRAALVQGVIPGGGAALLACRPVLRKRSECAADLDERMAFGILRRALEEPTRTILKNAGYDDEPIIRRIEKPGTGYSVRGGKFVDMVGAGILDSAGVIMSAVHEAVASAALALTVEVLVHHQKPITSVNP
jgi:chaperonin GroEL